MHQETITRLRDFRLSGFIDELVQQEESGSYTDLSFQDRLKLLIDAEHSRRNSNRVKSLFKRAKLPSSNASLGELRTQNGISKQKLLDLINSSWLTKGKNIVITGKTGVGKTFVGCAIAHTLCLRGTSVRYYRTLQWLNEMAIWEQKSRLYQSIANLRKVPLLIFDEWLRDKIPEKDSRNLLELFDSRYEVASCIFISQMPVNAWHSQFENPTIADAILDRIAHHSARIELAGESIRKANHTPEIIVKNNTQTELKK